MNNFCLRKIRCSKRKSITINLNFEMYFSLSSLTSTAGCAGRPEANLISCPLRDMLRVDRFLSFFFYFYQPRKTSIGFHNSSYSIFVGKTLARCETQQEYARTNIINLPMWNVYTRVCTYYSIWYIWLRRLICTGICMIIPRCCTAGGGGDTLICRRMTDRQLVGNWHRIKGFRAGTTTRIIHKTWLYNSRSSQSPLGETVGAGVVAYIL